MYLPCDQYINETVWLVYYKDGWVVRESRVLTVPYGMIAIDDDLDVGTPYWVGKSFYSMLKTLPILAPGTLGKKARTSDITVYVRSSRGGVIDVDGYAQSLQYPVADADYSGKLEVVCGGTYTEESQITIGTVGVWDLRILGLDANYKRYEK